MINRFVKLVVVILLTLIFVAAGFAQEENCELSSKSAPILLNLQLGISPEQAQTVLRNELKIKIKKSGERTFFQNFIKNPAPDSLNKVRALYLRFFDGKLYQIEIFYESRTDLQTLESISDALSSQLNLPVSNWEIKNNQAKIVCGENSLVADKVLNPRIELTDESVRARIEKSRTKDKK